MTIRKKIIICCLVAFIALGITIYGISKVLTNRVNNFVLNFAQKLTAEIGHPVVIDTVVTKWDWLLLKINVKNLKILDKDNNFTLFMASDIISTIDTLNSLRSLSLKFKHLLLRNPRLVMQWDGTQPPVIMGLNSENVAGEISPELIFKILATQRHIMVENGDLHLQGKNGADLPFMDVRVDFNQNADHEYTMTARGNIAAAVQPEFVLAVKYFGALDNYAKAMLEFEIKTSNMQIAELFNFVPKYRQSLVKGNFADFDLKGVVQNGSVRSIVSDFAISDISIAQDTVITGGVGHIEYKPGNNRTTVKLDRLTLVNTTLYTQPLTIDSVQSDLIYNELDDGQIIVATQDAQLQMLDMEVTPELNLQIDNNKLTKLELNVMPHEASLRKLLVLIPDKQFPLGLTEWFKRSFLNGEINLVNVNYDGQKLRWSLGFKDTELKFAQDWPSVHELDATLVMDDGTLSITASKAKIMGQAVKTLSTHFGAANGKSYSLVTIDGSMDTELETALDYIQHTPLQDNIGSKIAAFNPKGAMGLDLQLKINLSKPNIDINVNGALQLKDAKAQAADFDLAVQNMQGTMRFSNSTFESENLRLTLLDQPATAKISMHPVKANVLNIALSMPLKVGSLVKVMPAVSFAKVKGTTNITANIELPWGGDRTTKTLFVTSDLQGVEINYPAPFNKSAMTKMPLNIQFNMQQKHEDNLKFKFGGLLEGILFIKDQKLHGGRLAINKKLDAFNESESLMIKGEVDNLDWEDWAPFLQSNEQSDRLPIEIDVLIKSLHLHGDEYKPVHLKYNSAKNELYVDSAVFTGSIKTNYDDEKIEVKLEKLNIPQQRGKSNALLDYLQEKRRANKLPLVELYCDKLQFNQHLFRKVSLQLLPRTYGYEIMNFSINNDNLMLQAQGNWQMDNNSLTSLAGNIYTQNFGKIMDEWGYENSISRGKGELNFSVQWDGAPSDFDVLKLAGASHLDLRSGSLTNVNPGIGRIIGLLSLESIQRRLQLDFSDLLSRGFAFDKLVADIKLEPGKMMSDNILITSPAAKIELFGKTAIKSQDLDFTMYVTPKVGASLPIAAAIAAGPVVGAAIWLVDKASGSKISEITKYKYKVTGTWDKPQVNEVASKADSYANQAE